MFVEADGSVLIPQPGLKNIVRLTRDAPEPELVFQFDDTVHPTRRRPIAIHSGPSSDEIVVVIQEERMLIIQKNIRDPSVPDVDLVDFFGNVVPAQIGLDVQGWLVSDVKYDTSFVFFNVAVVTYFTKADSASENNIKVMFKIYFALKCDPLNWSLLESLDFPIVDISYNLPSPIVKDGMFMVSMVDKVKSSLTFFAFDYYEELMNINVLLKCAVLRDWKTLDKRTTMLGTDMSKVFDIIAQRYVASSANPKTLIEISSPQSKVYERTRNLLKSVELKIKNEATVASKTDNFE